MGLTWAGPLDTSWLVQAAHSGITDQIRRIAVSEPWESVSAVLGPAVLAWCVA